MCISQLQPSGYAVMSDHRIEDVIQFPSANWLIKSYV